MTEARKLLARSWLTKAQSDLTAAHQLATFDHPRLDVAIYHCQQAAEKALKAFLAYCDVEPPRTHDVEALAAVASSLDGSFAAWRDAGRYLTPFATAYRYPIDPDNMQPEQDEFAQAVDIAERLCAFVIALLPADTIPT